MTFGQFIEGLLAGLAGLCIVGCGHHDDEPPTFGTKPQENPGVTPATKPQRRPDEFAGSQTCRECHAGVAEQYAGHAMARSSGLIRASHTTADYDWSSFSVPGGWTFDARVDGGGRAWHREQKLNADGDVAFTYEQQMSAYIGSGRRGRTYFSQHEDMLFLSPLAWYANPQRWGLPPDTGARNPHFERRIIDDCLACHVGRVSSHPDGLENHFGDPAIIEHAIGCERCHGPAAGHVAWHRRRTDISPADDVEAEQTRDPIAKLSALTARQQNSVCNQCHLVGADRVLQYGHQPYDFRPGDDLSDIWLTFVTTATDDGRLTGHSTVEQMHAGICYQQSNGRLGCTSCHDPHQTPTAAERISWYRSRCIACHDTDAPCGLSREERVAQSPDDSCIACHMPSTPADQFHVAKTDHRILRKPMAESQGGKTGQQERFVLFDDAEDRVSPDAVQRARGLLMAQFAHREQDPLLALHATGILMPLLDVYPEDVTLRRSLGLMYGLQQDDDDAIAMFQAALAINPDCEETLKVLGILSHQMGDYRQGIDALERCLTLNPWDRTATGRQIHMLGLAGQFDRGIAVAEDARSRFPSDWQIHGWLAEVCRTKGRHKEAERHRKLSVILRPPTK